MFGIERHSTSDNYEYHKYLHIFQYITMLSCYNTIYTYTIQSELIIRESDEYTVFNLQFVTQNTGYTYL